MSSLDVPAPSTYVLFSRAAAQKPRGLSRCRMRGHARAFMTRLSHDSTCKSAPRSDLKRARTYRSRLNGEESISVCVAQGFISYSIRKPIARVLLDREGGSVRPSERSFRKPLGRNFLSRQSLVFGHRRGSTVPFFDEHVCAYLPIATSQFSLFAPVPLSAFLAPLCSGAVI